MQAMIRLIMVLAAVGSAYAEPAPLISFRLVRAAAAANTAPMQLGSSDTVLNVEKTSSLDDLDIQSAIAEKDHEQSRVVLTFTPESAGRLRTYMTQHLKERLAIVIDGRLIMAPVIREPIRGNQMAISGVGLWNDQEARDLAERIKGVVKNH